MAKSRCSIGKFINVCKRWRIPTETTRADFWRTLYGHIGKLTELRWECLPTRSSLELEELRLEAYENSRFYKKKVKQFHDNKILRKEFRVGYKLIADKLHSRWDGPFVITNVYPYGVVELREEAKNRNFKVNEHQIKPYHERPTLMVAHYKPKRQKTMIHLNLGGQRSFGIVLGRFHISVGVILQGIASKRLKLEFQMKSSQLKLKSSRPDEFLSKATLTPSPHAHSVSNIVDSKCRSRPIYPDSSRQQDRLRLSDFEHVIDRKPKPITSIIPPNSRLGLCKPSVSNGRIKLHPWKTWKTKAQDPRESSSGIKSILGVFLFKFLERKSFLDSIILLHGLEHDHALEQTQPKNKASSTLSKSAFKGPKSHPKVGASKGPLSKGPRCHPKDLSSKGPEQVPRHPKEVQMLLDDENPKPLEHGIQPSSQPTTGGPGREHLNQAETWPMQAK
ncbi:hypothetical protein CR513_23158, partial [Mucuna pruriens]